MKFGFVTADGLNTLETECGARMSFSMTVRGREYQRLFPNVGQPLQDPPKYSHYKDDPDVLSDVRLGICSLDPFFAKYTVRGGNVFRWLEDGDRVLLHGEVHDHVRVDVINRENAEVTYEVRGAALDRGGRSSFLFSFGPAATRRPLPTRDEFETRWNHTTDRDFNPALASVFYNMCRNRKGGPARYIAAHKLWPGVIARDLGVDEVQPEPFLLGCEGACASLVLAPFNYELAVENLRATFSSLRPDGCLPQIRIGGRYSNRTGPPIWFMTAYTLYSFRKDIEFLREMFPLLLSNYRWFKANRMNANGTFSWGTADLAGIGSGPHAVELSGESGLAGESGLDDSPLFEEMESSGGRLNYACIDLSFLMYRACFVLRKFVQLLREAGDKLSRATVQEIDSDILFFKKAARTFMIAGAVPNSYPLHDPQRPSSVLTPLSFYPLLTPWVTRAEVRQLRELLRSDHFLREFLLPSVSYLHPAHDGDGDACRGRIWPLLVYLVAEGFRLHDPDTYGWIKERATELLYDEWERDGHVHANYSSVTGRGEPLEGGYARSCPLHCWGGLLGVL